ncbi:hypothetical protein [Prescottella agglutinans]|uniref:hypothetical protein n=1 Tax=Prescottella agglutinans TaxID=1644129 RepID=UPI003D9802A2
MKRRLFVGLMVVTAGILTVPAVGTAAAEETDGGTNCDLIYPPTPGCEAEGNSSSVGSVSSADLAMALVALTNTLSLGGSVES